MGFKKDKQLKSSLNVPQAYGRIERVLGIKDGSMDVVFCWWATEQAARDRLQTIDGEKFTVSAKRIENNKDLKSAYDEFVKQLYIELEKEELNGATSA